VSGDDAHVLIVGYGPVGQVLANLLAMQGWRVDVVERWPAAYPMPRAVAFDTEAARILACAGVGDAIDDVGEPSGEYTWRNASGETLLHIDADPRGLCGWAESTSMYQPGLEAALTRFGAALPTLRVLRGHRAVELVPDSDGVEVVVEDSDGDPVALRAQWVVGCDGANSFVREHVGTGFVDRGFSHDWLICDVVPHRRRGFQPNNLQICDPARPRTEVSAGPGHRRWEFMRIAGETVAELNTARSAWRLLDLFGIHPGNATLERFHVYTFQARWATRWRSGRLLLAGDAAHVMPPFAAQGMCSGFRDVANLAWKLSAVLAGRAGVELIDSYEVERLAHVQHAVDLSVNMGRVLCQTDPRAAADRDAVMLEARQRGVRTARPKAELVFPRLTDGFLARGKRGGVGELTPQGRVSRRGATGWFDDLVGTGFVLITTMDPDRLLDPRTRSTLDALGTRIAHLVPAGSPADHRMTSYVDVDGVYLPYLTRIDAVALLVRPDFYVFGVAADPAGLTALVDELRQRLGASVSEE
jgi:flavoprotein hydroxylase